MKKLLLVITALIVWSTIAHTEPAGKIFHYACKSGDDHYALTVHRNSVKLGRSKLSIDYLPDNIEERKAMAERHPDLEGCEVFMLCDDGGDWHPKPIKGGE